MNTNNYSLEVHINGRPAREFYKDQRAFIEGREGSQYTLKFRNNSWKRVLAVFSVDGIEVIEGKVATEFKGGYVIDPFSSIEIKGYRIDEDSVAAFRFAKTHKSYSNTVGGASVDTKTGEVEYTKTTRNNGIIGVRVFEEKPKPAPKLETYGYSGWAYTSPLYASGLSYTVGNVAISGCCITSVTTGGFFPSRSYDQHEVLPYFTIYATGCASALHNINSTVNGSFADEQEKVRGVISASYTASSYTVDRQDINQYGQLSSVSRSIVTPPVSTPIAPDFNLGTTWGEKVSDKIKEVDFEKTEEFTDIEIYYDSRESLAFYGIDFEATKQIAKWPSAFEDKRKQFCKVPENYKG